MARGLFWWLVAAMVAACAQTQDTAQPSTIEAALENEAAFPNDVVEETIQGPEAPTPVDYSVPSNWLCHPSLEMDACDTDLATTIVKTDGATNLETFTLAEAPKFDCFYIYPTVSEDTSPNSDMVANAEERQVIQQQFARFGSICRLYAPLYRQVTLTHLLSFMATGEYKAHPTLNYDDVKSAWETYLAEENQGRGIILLGHSQGADLILQLTSAEIADSDVMDRIISVMPIGTNIYPDETGAYPLPPCETASDTGCMVGYVSFRGDRAPPTDTPLGKTQSANKRALCVNPAIVSGDDGVLNANLARRAFAAGVEGTFGEGVQVETPFAAVPGLLTAECRNNDTHTWLAININADPEDARTDDITGDVVIDGLILEDWGLHLIDMNAAMGNLISLGQQQAAAWMQASKQSSEQVSAD